MSITFTDIFCGAGGSSIGLKAAGLELKLAANHWQVAIDTHQTNFPDARHECADINNYDMRKLPTTDVLWASPICTEMSPAGRKRRRHQRQQMELDLEENGHVEQAGYEKTRATFMDIIRATEVHRYKIVLVENVVDVATEWELFDWWVSGMRKLGYRVQFISCSTAHIGSETNDYAAQWRDRLYMMFTREDIRQPKVEPRPLAWCPECDEVVRARQSWRKVRVRHIGKYRSQYDYRCPHARCRHAIIEPYVAPAASLIDWSDPGVRIGERAEHGLPPLRPNTLRRIQAGLDMFTGGPTMITLTHGGDDPRAYPAWGGPLPTRTAKIGDGLACPPMLVPSGGTWRDDATSVDNPLPARTTRENDALMCPPFVITLRQHAVPAGADMPLASVTAGGNHHGLTTPPGALDDTTSLTYPTLVIPYRKGSKAHRTDQPMSTLTTRDQHGLLILHRPIEVEECRYRMLRPREQLRAQRFPDSYRVLGNVSEQTMQAGNAVSANVAQWLGEACVSVL